MKEITEHEFDEACRDGLSELAGLIKGSGLSLYEIAKGCRIAWKTVKKVACSSPVRACTEARIRYYVERAGKRRQKPI